ncbi:Acetyltransferase (GNAT) family protein [Nannocystis exedens]|uniref:Acetyltransferase (GNAT) family protein n=1 Tax=Nannocystis exedens TaxID=54 RepID=A0A1I2GJ57_9BACT|nr:GNAT family N-acetyltransferase [Nannocystis exedens]PCC69913.1 GNAT family N-acetyltransferase [Nannocystis exedens]SFF16776.1 Acetyltransferase (GNAT) family protein [Nannocystis exedens]
MALAHRPAVDGDYAIFARLFPELDTGDPIPSPAHWAAEIAPNTWLFEQDGAAVGYLFFERLEGVGYIRHVVVAPEHRGRGLGLAMLRAAAAELRAAGCATWCLNVKPGNLPAVGLYQRLGMREAYRSTALRFAWSQVDALPAPDRSLQTCAIEPADDAAIEAAFALPRGQLAGNRAAGRVLLRLLDPAEPTAVHLGFASFNPDFPGAFPFRVASPEFAAPLLAGLRPHARDDKPDMGIVAEADPGLTARLVAIGARVHMEFCHFQGHVPEDMP